MQGQGDWCTRVALRRLVDASHAFNCFTQWLFSFSEKAITLDKYVLPFSEVELCQIALEEGDIEEAKKHLEKAW